MLCDIFGFDYTASVIRKVMKKLLPLSFLFFAILSKAQTSIYHPFPDSNAVWNEEGSSVFGGAPPEWYHWQQRYFINGDTIINYTYHKIYVKRIDEYPPFVSYCHSYVIPGIPLTDYFGAIRQDTLQKKVFFLPSGSLNDTLLYNFNLNLGDTLPPTYNHQTTLIVNHVDSMFDGTNYRKYFSLSDVFHSDSVAIIEGIGSSRGLFWWLDPPFEAGNSLHCFEQNGATLFSDSCPNSCDMANQGQFNKNKK